MSSYGGTSSNDARMTVYTPACTGTLKLSLEEESKWLARPQDICWSRGGLIRILPKAVIQNTVNLRNEKRQPGLPQAALQFGWEETLPFTNTTPRGKVLRL